MTGATYTATELRECLGPHAMYWSSSDLEDIAASLNRTAIPNAKQHTDFTLVEAAPPKLKKPRKKRR
jgi:hypothetical protein